MESCEIVTFQNTSFYCPVLETLEHSQQQSIHFLHELVHTGDTGGVKVICRAFHLAQQAIKSVYNYSHWACNKVTILLDILV